MSARFDEAITLARAEHADAWPTMAQSARTAAVFHYLCKLDTGCQRTGTDADAALPPCPASDSFIARRACRLAGRRTE